MAVALCKKLSVDPIDLLAKDHMKQLQLDLMRFGQFIPGYKLKDPLDFVGRASSIEATSEFQISDSELPPNGPPKVLTRSLAQMLPLPAGPVPKFVITAQAVEETTLTVQLRVSEKAYNYTPEVVLSEREYSLVPGDNDLAIDLGVSVPQTQYAFLCFMQNDCVALSTTLIRVSALMTVEHECTQSPPDVVGVDTFERWTPVRRPMGHNLALRVVDQPLKAWPVESIRNGVSRPTKRTNCWVPSNGGGRGARKMLTIRWDQPVRASKMVVCFDSDFDNALESVLRGHPERDIPFCVKSWRVLDLSEDGKEAELYRETDNHLSRREISIDPSVLVNAIGVEILEINGDGKYVRGGIFEVRVYE